ncbi:PREDICTED: uncharacterized protein LOC109215537 [Nicotiana attenuata]|uniref:uncharacterized protein LOC109215537 n=1 Tax=Nicotiana attenuata TaxID=49451 RepID=UPI000905290F|nr:PREDICTED: uncharacterized protein LOC109215537 [Nicotiana attenuata]
MADKFVTAHAGVKNADARVNDIFAIKQSPSEGLRDFLARFNRVRMTLPNVSEGMAVAAFQNGLNRKGSRATRKFLSPLMKYLQPLGTRYTMPTAPKNSLRPGEAQPKSEMAAEDKVRPKHQKVKRPLRISSGMGPQNRGLHRSQERGREHASPRTFERTSKRSRKGKLCSRMRTASGSTKTTLPNSNHPNDHRRRRQRVNQKRKIYDHHKLKRSITHEWCDELEDSIIFDKSDTHDLVLPHYDALVITLHILDTDVKHIMVDDGSGACIVNPRVLAQMKLEDWIVPRCITLTGFKNAIKRTSQEITLAVLDGSVTLETTLHIMDQDMAYNAIIGRPWIHTMKAVPSILYQVIKFPTPWGVFSIRGEQHTARECYRIAQDCTYTQQLKGKAESA